MGGLFPSILTPELARNFSRFEANRCKIATGINDEWLSIIRSTIESLTEREMSQ
jgi:hypothetical protein